MKIVKIATQKEARDFEGYFEGDIPDQAVGLLGSSSVDASQINSMFGRSSEAVGLVNQFDSSLLSNISFVFNFAKSGAYGVYLSELDKAIKEKALRVQLEQKGYTVRTDEQGMLKIFAPDGSEQANEEVQKQDIDTLYQQLESQGGSAIGINMARVLQASKQDASDSESEDPNIWEWMTVLHLGGTIVHEATHAQGAKDEAGPEAQEAAFLAWALPRVNNMYESDLRSKGQEELFAPLNMGTGMRSAKNKNWYRTAALNFYPSAIYNRPTGSDISGRFPQQYIPESGRAAWGLEMQQDQNVPIEKRLSREFMSPLPDGLNQEHDILEEQLRKYTRDDKKLDPDAIIEELLSEGHTEPQGYTSIEKLLDDTRPKPLLLPFRQASKMKKEATVFGWMNNLEVSDGNTIPGLSDRVMAWDDRDESFSGTESDIRKQPRYNPTYDIKGYYYRYVEPRFAPQLFDDMTRDYSGTHPAKRFAAKERFDPEFVKILAILTIVKEKIDKREVSNTRLIVSEDLLPLIDKLLVDGPTRQVNFFVCGDACVATEERDEEVFAIWVSTPDVSVNEINQAEKYLQGKGNQNSEEDDVELVEKLLGGEQRKQKVIKKVLAEVKSVCREYGIRDIYVAGGYPRDLAMGESQSSVDDLDFSCAWPNQSLKVGGLVAERLGVADVEIYHRTMTLSFVYGDLKVDFKGNFTPIEIREKLREENLPTTPLNFDIYNRDFTMNMMIYDLKDGKIFDVTGSAQRDIEAKLIRTFFDPQFICRENPLIIARALKFKIRFGFEIDPALEKAMIENAPRLFDGKYTKERLIVAKEAVQKEGIKEANELFEEYGLQRLLEI